MAVPVSDACAATAYRPEEPCAARAVAAASLHASQGFDKFAPRFYRDTTYYELVRSAPGAPPLPPEAHDLAAGLSLRSEPPIESPTRAEGLTYLIDSGRVPPLAGLSVSDSVVVPGQPVEIRWSARGPGTLTLMRDGGTLGSARLGEGRLDVALPAEHEADAPGTRRHVRRLRLGSTR